MEDQVVSVGTWRKWGSISTSASKRAQRIIKEEIQEPLDEKPHIVKRLVGDEEDKDCCSLETVPGMADELFLEASLILEDDKKAKMLQLERSGYTENFPSSIQVARCKF
ncbi:PREDICTED: PRUPE_6G328700 [Prunus dulcis]|uniref:PREDICTED: PRUPE_6G328700 n=1 Tax=Prunus dulcis TaxID=3755 RepID=A0A5E4FQZ8_PRUDU|nr:PREDICTED: PRUPE_6G328700 [Prunus dulcis]